MSTENGAPRGHVVDFSVAMTPSTAVRIMPPAQRATESAEPLSAEALHRGTKGGLMLMRILTMSDDEKRAHAVTQIGDPLFMWWSFLTFEERREILTAAEKNLKEKLMG